MNWYMVNELARQFGLDEPSTDKEEWHIHVDSENRVDFLNQGHSIFLIGGLGKAADGGERILKTLVAGMNQMQESVVMDSGGELQLLRRLPNPRSLEETKECLEDFLSSYGQLRSLT